MHTLCSVELYVIVNVVKNNDNHTMILWRFDVACSNKLFLSSCKVPDILSDFNQIWILEPGEHKGLQYQITERSFQWEPR
jgi:hypothetical protein